MCVYRHSDEFVRKKMLASVSTMKSYKFSSTVQIPISEYNTDSLYELELIIDIGGNTAPPSLENKLRIHLQLNECQNCLEQALALTVNLSCDYDMNKIHLTRTSGKFAIFSPAKCHNPLFVLQQVSAQNTNMLF